MTPKFNTTLNKTPISWKQLMALRETGQDTFESLTPAWPPAPFTRTFGGHVYAQAVYAASKTIDAGFFVHVRSTLQITITRNMRIAPLSPLFSLSLAPPPPPLLFLLVTMMIDMHNFPPGYIASDGIFHSTWRSRHTLCVSRAADPGRGNLQPTHGGSIPGDGSGRVGQIPLFHSDGVVQATGEQQPQIRRVLPPTPTSRPHPHHIPQRAERQTTR